MEGIKQIWSLAGGCKETGKSLLAANLSAALALKGKDVVAVDADPAGPGIHSYLGMERAASLFEDFVSGSVEGLDAASIETSVKGLRLISGADTLARYLSAGHPERERLLSGLRALGADCIVVDLGGSASYPVIDLFGDSDRGIIVVTPEPRTIEGAYSFLKGSVFRKLMRLFPPGSRASSVIKESTDPAKAGSVKSFSELSQRVAKEDEEAAERAVKEISAFRPGIILNMASSSEDIRLVDALKDAAKKYLGIEAAFIGSFGLVPAAKDEVRKMSPFIFRDAHEKESGEIDGLVSSLTGEEPRPVESPREGPQPMPVPPPSPAASGGKAGGGGGGGGGGGAGDMPHFGFNDNIEHEGALFHVQTEVRTGKDPLIETSVYRGGRVLFSKKTFWREALKSQGGGEGLKEFAVRQHRTAIAALKMKRIDVKEERQ